MRLVMIRLSEETLKKIDLLVRRGLFRSRSEFIRYAIAHALDIEGNGLWRTLNIKCRKKIKELADNYGLGVYVEDKRIVIGPFVIERNGKAIFKNERWILKKGEIEIANNRYLPKLLRKIEQLLERRNGTLQHI